MKKTITLLVSFMLLTVVSCSDDDPNPMGNITPSARIDRIVFTEIPIFTVTKPSDYNYFSMISNFSSTTAYSETINLKDESIYNETSGLVSDLTLTYNDYVIEANGSVTLHVNILFGESSTDNTIDLDNLTNLPLTTIYQFDNAETFQKTYSIEMNSTNTLLENSEGTYNFTVYGTFIYE